MKWIIVFIILMVPGLLLGGEKEREAYHSISFRNPRSEDAELTDYEFKLGYSGSLILERLHLIYERQDDAIYRGIDLHTHRTKSDNIFLDGYSAEIFIAESYPINEQWLYRRLVSVLNTDLRLSGRWDTWEFYGLFLGVKTLFEFNVWRLATYYETSFDTNFLGDNIWRNNIVLAYANQSLRLVRHLGPGVDHWQVKQEGTYRW